MVELIGIYAFFAQGAAVGVVLFAALYIYCRVRCGKFTLKKFFESLEKTLDKYMKM